MDPNFTVIKGVDCIYMCVYKNIYIKTHSNLNSLEGLAEVIAVLLTKTHTIIKLTLIDIHTSFMFYKLQITTKPGAIYMLNNMQSSNLGFITITYDLSSPKDHYSTAGYQTQLHRLAS